ncbi:histone-like nucleoid-structuring protein Lsr2 [Thermomonospora umbrina]|uniref:Lsr2 protein n=1 Tax=Thermomonospora umbrina TaxID=111806 RepID=A0A3D9SY20_9ACTN|nr:Lsr2 family protein [Thermomonospora umbrina]REF00749.1 Lsr2 protein [Thermomonospora umbrina]
MAQKVQVLLVDDLDGGDADETVTFGLDGAVYEIDLSTDNGKKLRHALEPFIKAARKGGGSRGSGARGRRSRTPSSRERSADIRAWARARGIKVNDRGRIPATVVEQYDSAN